jgi:transposase-like protein
MSRRKYTARFKFDRVVESIKKDNISQVARQYGFGANLLSKWRSDFLKNGHQVFESQPDKNVLKLQKRVKQLERLVGKKEVELNLIRNFADFYESHGGA